MKNRKIIYLVFCSALIGFILMGVLNDSLHARETFQNDSVVNIYVSSDKSTHRSNEVSIDIVFENLTDENIRILDCFDPLPVFFSFNIKKEDGTYLDLPGAGKIAFSQGDLKYINVEPNESHTLHLDISNFIESYGTKFSKGKYEIQVHYHNQYGDDCIKGWFEIEPTEFNIE